MENKYYVLTLLHYGIEGPYTFREAVETQRLYSSSGIECQVLKIVLNSKGDLLE